jgi:hypothetical protein
VLLQLWPNGACVGSVKVSARGYRRLLFSGQLLALSTLGQPDHIVRGRAFDPHRPHVVRPSAAPATGEAPRLAVLLRGQVADMPAGMAADSDYFVAHALQRATSTAFRRSSPIGVQALDIFLGPDYRPDFRNG